MGGRRRRRQASRHRRQTVLRLVGQPQRVLGALVGEGLRKVSLNAAASLIKPHESVKRN